MAVYVYKDLKQCAEKIAAAFGLSDDDGRRVIGWFNVNQREKIADIIAGDLSGVPSVLDSLGIGEKIGMGSAQGVNTSKPGGGSPVRDSKQKSRKGSAEKKRPTAEKPRKAGGVSSPAVDITTGAAVECETVPDVPGVLPDNVPGLVQDIIVSFCEQNNIDDLSKERQP